MKQRLIPTFRIDNGFDRQNLNIIDKRFKAINADRLSRMRGALQDRHKAFLDALPILLHCNHPMLPGFVNRHVPCKISEFKPEKPDILAAKTLARSFTLNYEPEIPESIQGVYVMGSVGTIAQSDRSDLDVWLCYEPSLNQKSIQLLQQKCERISEWATQQRLEVHFFLMDCEAFKRGHISTLDKESSGSAQRLLLLDEFYRSAIHIAGRTPLWWCVPENDEPEYAAHTHTLLEKRFVNPNKVLDFGGVAAIPSGEFIGAGIWQLYKAIESPYKSVLKLLLLEAYVSEYPDIQPLSIQFKQSIFDGELDIDELDSYVLVYQRIEAYLKKNHQYKRLELARRCFYFKVGCQLSRSSKHHARPWQREILSKMVAEWQWSTEDIALLDARKRWKIATVVSERAMLANELNHSYHFLLEFAQGQNESRSISTEELTVLGRKLQAAFERRPGKIEWINPNISKDVSEDEIAIRHRKGSKEQPETWTALAFSGTFAARENTNVHSSVHFVELIVWCFYNGIIQSHTRLDFSDSPLVDLQQTRRLLDTLGRWLPKPQAPVKHEHFFKAAQPEKILLLINVGATTQSELQEQGLQRLSQKSDPLRFGSRNESLVASIDLISVNSWQEVHVRRFDRDSALLDALKEYMRMTLPNTHHAPPELTIECIGGDYGQIIEHRVTEFFDEINRCFYSKHKGQHRYIFRLEQAFHVLQFIGMRPTIAAYQKESQLFTALGQEHKEFSGISVDSRCLQNSPIPLIASKMRRNTVSVFYRRFEAGMETFIADEKGSIVHFVEKRQQDKNTLSPLHRFLRAAIARQAKSHPDLLADFGICPIYFYELTQPAEQRITARQTPISQSVRQKSMFEVKAIAFSDDNEQVLYDFYCDDQEFSARSFNEQLFLVVAQFVLSRRNNGENYPIYITDLDLSLCNELLSANGELQISHYLDVKNTLEAKLNQAIGVLSNA